MYYVYMFAFAVCACVCVCVCVCEYTLKYINTYMHDVYCNSYMQNFLGVQTLSIGVPNRVTDDICGPTPAAQGIISPMESFNLVFPPSLRRQIFSSTSQITTGKICILYILSSSAIL